MLCHIILFEIEYVYIKQLIKIMICMIFCSFVVVSMKYIHLHLPYQVKRFCLKLRYVYI